MNRTSLAICLAATMVATVGCSSKNYVKQQTTPLINKTNELDDLTAKNSKEIKDVDDRAQAGIQAVNAKTAEVEQKTQTASQSAAQAQQVADAANSRVGVLTITVANLDNYHSVAETSVKFGFNRHWSWTNAPVRLVGVAKGAVASGVKSVPLGVKVSCS